MSFVHLHTHSHYSLLSALPKIPELVKKAASWGMPALALTDNGNLYGAIEFYKACKKNNVKPIIGVDFYLATRSRHDRESGIDNRRHRLILLAENEEGYKNLIKLVSISHKEGFYYKPRIDKELLQTYYQGLICIIPVFGSPIAQQLRVGNHAEAQKEFSFYIDTFGKKNIFFEVSHHPEIEGHDSLSEAAISFAKQNEFGIVASNNVQYMAPEDAPARRTLLSIQSNPEPGSRAFLDSEADFSFTSADHMQKLFAHMPEAIANTLAIADRCNLELELGKWTFPNVYIPENTTYADELRRLTREGLQNRGLEETEEIKQRLEYELTTIIDKGYAPYFLVVGDLLRYARENGILSTIRGSVAGSLVTYVLNITKINPLEYQLPFERFLNPERPSPPDIDMDFADNRRDEMIEYAKQTYGDDKVAQIGTFGTMMARGAVRDTARALGYEYSIGDHIAKLIPMGSQGFPMSIDRAMEESPELKALYKSDDDAKRIIDMAKKVEGCARHISVHAAGVVISATSLDTVVPIQYDPKGEGKLITQYDMHSVEDAGLLKFDFLGLKNLAILADAIKRVNKIYVIDLDPEALELTDKKTYEMLARGETMSVFQLSGPAMTQFLKELQPNNIHDINAMIALYRPGPMKNIPEYIARKHGKKPIRYYHPKMRTFLERSYGILVYQDDLLSTALELAGYTWKTVDAFRKAVGKKIPEEMAKQHVIFVDGCIEHSGMSKQEAEAIWELFEPFQGYGFNKAHAASYGRVAYQTAYMKAHYPAAYMAAVLTADAGDIEKISEIITECKRMGIEVLPPDINESFLDFSVVTKDLTADGKDKIRFGLCSIKNFGEGIGNTIIEERKANGEYLSLENFLERIHDRNLNKKSLEALIQSGALDRFGERGALLRNVPELLAHNKQSTQHGGTQDSLFGLFSDNSQSPKLVFKDMTPATREEKLNWEKELLGLYISGHPLDTHKEFLEKAHASIEKIKSAPAGLTTVVYGLIDEVRMLLTKKGDKMAFLKISDMSDHIEVVAFPKTYEEYQALLIPQTCVGIKGKMSKRNGESSIIADKIKLLK